MARRRGGGTPLGRALVALRGKRRQMDVVAATGITQSQLSRIEQGDSLPTLEGEEGSEGDETSLLLDLYEATDEQRADIIRQVKEARAGVQDTRLVVQRGGTLAMQRRWRTLLDETTLVRAYQPGMVLGELQTAEYAAVVFDRPPDSPEVAARLGHAAAAAPDRQHVLIQSEGSLLFPVGSRQTMADQLDAIVEASRLPNVELGVLTADVPLQVTTPVGFNLYDERTAVVGLKVAAAPLSATADVEVFRDLFDRLAEAAVFGEDARAAVERIATRYR